MGAASLVVAYSRSPNPQPFAVQALTRTEYTVNGFSPVINLLLFSPT